LPPVVAIKSADIECTARFGVILFNNMLKFFAHCWLILSLLVVPLQFAAADMAVLDHAEMKCEMMDMHGQHEMQGSSMDHDMTKDGCECPDQCKVDCAGAHISLGIASIMQVTKVSSSIMVSALTISIYGIDHLTELRPPIA
jgi:hypothetical protein